MRVGAVRTFCSGSVHKVLIITVPLISLISLIGAGVTPYSVTMTSMLGSGTLALASTRQRIPGVILLDAPALAQSASQTSPSWREVKYKDFPLRENLRCKLTVGIEYEHTHTDTNTYTKTGLT